MTNLNFRCCNQEGASPGNHQFTGLVKFRAGTVWVW